MKNSQEYASLFGPAHDTFEEAQEWVRKVIAKDITTFVPVHGKVAGYHIEPSADVVPIQKFDPQPKEGSEMNITDSWYIGISLMPDEEGVMKFYPHLNVDVEYDTDETSPE